MGDVPVLRPREVAGILERLGSSKFASADHIGSTANADGRATTVPFHPGRDISPTLLRVIARDIGMDVRDFVARR